MAKDKPLHAEALRDQARIVACLKIREADQFAEFHSAQMMMSQQEKQWEH